MEKEEGELMDGGMYDEIVRLKQKVNMVEGKTNMLIGLISGRKHTLEEVSRVLNAYLAQCESCTSANCRGCDIKIVIDALADEKMLVGV